MSRFLETMIWEFCQNLPVILSFVAGVWLWARGKRAAALGCAVAGAIGGALIISLTERMFAGGREPFTVTLTNMFVLSILQALFVIYLGSDNKWSGFKSDLLLGGTAGAGLAIAQGLAAPGTSLIGVILHAVALALAGALILIGIRSLKKQTLVGALWRAALITVVMSLLIGFIDYSYMLLI